MTINIEDTSRDGTADLTLPLGFEDLLEFVPEWVGEDAQARWDIRASHTMEEIRHYYDAVLARAEDILTHVEAFPLDALPPPSLRLYQLLLGLAQAAMAIELHNQPRARNSPWPHYVRILRGAQPID